jgi:peptidoglycan/xylan/chitin deacetylase (PgdA/CDA1 family)
LLRGKCLVLAYHGIVPDGAPPAGERNLFVTQREFAAQLDMLSEVADVVPLARVDEGGEQARPRVAITLDDAYRGAVCEGVAELVKRQLPATMFVSPARLGGHTFWWDALTSANGMLDERVRQFALSMLRGHDERVRSWAASAGIPTSCGLPEYARTASRAELRAAVARPGITAGSHTWSHANLSRLNVAEIMSEVARSRGWLKSEFGERAIDWLAYPYGLDSVAVHHALADASYAGGLRIVGGWHLPSSVPRFARPRLNVPAGLSVAGLRARAIGAMAS